MSKRASRGKRFKTVRDVRNYLFAERNQDGKRVIVESDDGKIRERGTVREVRQWLTFNVYDQDAPRGLKVQVSK